MKMRFSPGFLLLSEADYSRVCMFSILALSALLRLSFLTSNPIGFYADEASIGYDAYSILKTGRDQYGEFLPLFARTFGGYDEALHRYLVVPFVAVLGLTEFAVRLPNALIGILTVWVLYILVKVWFNRRVALLSALFLAISPWHIQFSRWSVRAIMLPLFFCLGLYFFLRCQKHPRYIFLSALTFAVCLHTYSSARVFVPLFLIGLIILLWEILWKIRNWTIWACVLFLSIFVPLCMFWISPEGMTRADTLIVRDLGAILRNYVAYFDPRFLFFKGDPNLRHSPLFVGQLHYVECITVLAGILGLRKQKRREDRIVWLWLFLYPIPAALTEPNHAIRSIAGAPLFATLSGYGVYYLANNIARTGNLKTYTILSISILAISCGIFCKRYFRDYPKDSIVWWQYGMKEILSFAERSPHPCLIHGRLYSFMPTYIFVLFYTQFPPSEYQRLPLHLREGLWQTERPLGKYYTVNVAELVIRRGTYLLVIRPDDLKEIIKKGYRWHKAHTVSDPCGNKIFEIIEVTGSEP